MDYKIADQVLIYLEKNNKFRSFRECHEYIKTIELIDISRFEILINQLISDGYLNPINNAAGLILTEKGVEACQYGLAEFIEREKEKSNLQLKLNKEMIESIKDQKKDRRRNKWTTTIIIILSFLSAMAAIYALIKPYLCSTD